MNMQSLEESSRKSFWKQKHFRKEDWNLRECSGKGLPQGQPVSGPQGGLCPHLHLNQILEDILHVRHLAIMLQMPRFRFGSVTETPPGYLPLSLHYDCLCEGLSL